MELRKTGAERAKARGQMMIRKATEADVRQIAEILVEDWKTAYRGIMDDGFLDAMNVEQRCQIEIQRYQKYVVAVEGREVLGYAWNELIDDDAADCEIVALYVRYSRRKSGIGRALLLHSMDFFRKCGRKKMIVWCLEANREARAFYEKMGGMAHQAGTHRWGDRDYDIVSYLYPLEGEGD